MQVTEDCYDVCASCIDSMLRITFELCHSSTFRKLFKCFIEAVFQSSILFAESGSVLFHSLNSTFVQIQSHSQQKLGLLGPALCACKSCWSPKNGPNIDEINSISYLVKYILSQSALFEKSSIQSFSILSAFNHLDFLLHCLTYSPPSLKDIKSFEQAICQTNMTLTSTDIDLGKFGSFYYNFIFVLLCFFNILISKKRRNT